MPEREPRRRVPPVRKNETSPVQRNRDAEYWITSLSLEKHPEGGYYRRTYRSSALMPEGCHPGDHKGPRAVLSCIHYLLEGHDFSAFHSLKSWEVWSFHDGGTLRLHIITPDGTLTTRRLGMDVENGESLREVIEPGSWFAAELADPASYALVGCVVAPGFEFEDWCLADREELLSRYPSHRSLIERLCRSFRQSLHS